MGCAASDENNDEGGVKGTYVAKGPDGLAADAGLTTPLVLSEAGKEEPTGEQISVFVTERILIRTYVIQEGPDATKVCDIVRLAQRKLEEAAGANFPVPTDFTIVGVSSPSVVKDGLMYMACDGIAELDGWEAEKPGDVPERCLLIMSDLWHTNEWSGFGTSKRLISQNKQEGFLKALAEETYWTAATKPEERRLVMLHNTDLKHDPALLPPDDDL